MPPDTYLDNSVVGFDPQSNLRFQVDTYNRLSPIMNLKNQPMFTGNEPSVLHDNFAAAESTKAPRDLPNISITDALSSDDPTIQDIGRTSMEDWMQKNVPEYKLGLGREVDTPYDQGKKFLNKDYGFSKFRDNEDFYYRNDYMNSSWASRNLIKNPLRFLGRLIGGTVAKVGESLGYMGSMITSIGSDNYFEKVADNGFSKWFENQEQTLKDDLIPIYKQAGFDDKGFFSKLGDWSFWNDEVADAGAFMASAMVQTLATDGLGNITGLGKVGSLGINTESKLSNYGLGKFGRGVDGTIKFLTGADNVAGVANHAFNTASESFFESAGVFKETKQDLVDQRKAGQNSYTDDQIDKIASQRAASDFKGNLMALTLSNAFENKYIFQPFKRFVKGTGEISIGKTEASIGAISSDVEASLAAEAKTYNYSTKAGKFFDWKNPQGRLRFYGTRALTSAAVEGLYEENIQLAMERMARYGDYENKNTLQAIGGTLGKSVSQAGAAFRGEDKEAAESIGLGALIGIAGTGAIGKIFGGQRFLQGERRAEIDYANDTIGKYNELRKQFLSVGDVYKKKDDGTFDTDAEGNLVFDEDKIKARAAGLESELKKGITADQLRNPVSRKLLQDDLLSNFVHALVSAGLEESFLNRVKGLQSKSPAEIKALGFNPAEINTTPADLVKSVEDLIDMHKQSFGSTVLRPNGVSSKDYQSSEEERRFYLYKSRALAMAAGKAFTTVDNSLREQSVTESQSPDNDSAVQEHNSLVMQLAGIQQFEKLTNQNTTFYKDHVRARKVDLQKRIKELRDSLEDKVNSGEITDNDGLLLSPSVAKDYVNNDLNMIAQMQHATSRNSEEQWKYIANKLSSIRDGYTNFQEYKKYQNSLATTDDKADEIDISGPHVVEKNADGTFSVKTPQGEVVGAPFKTEDEAKVFAQENDEISTPANVVEQAQVVEPQPGEESQQENQTEDVGVDTGIDVTPPIVEESKFIPDEADPLKPVTWQYPSITSKRDTENVSPTEEQLSADNYSMMRAELIKKLIFPDPNFDKKYKLFIVKDSFPEVYKQNKTPIVQEVDGKWSFIDPSVVGEVVILQRLDGTIPKVKDFFPNKYQDFAEQPLIFSFDQNVFFGDLYQNRLTIKAEKMKMSLEDADNENRRLRDEADVAREEVRNKDTKVEVKMMHSTYGVNPKTRTKEAVQKRFGDFSFEIAKPIAAGEKATQFATKYAPGTVVAKIENQNFPVFTLKLSEYPDIFSKVQAALDKKYSTVEEAQIVRNQFLNTFVLTNESQFFTIDKDGENFVIHFRKAKDENVGKERQQIRREGIISDALIGDVNLNVSDSALRNGYTDFNAENGDTEFLGKEDYISLIKPKLVTNLKKVTDEKGNLYMEPVNPYFSFIVAGSPQEKTIQKNNYDSLKQRITNLAATNSVDLTKIMAGLEEQLRLGYITSEQHDELRQYAESHKPSKTSAESFLENLEKMKDTMDPAAYQLALQLAQKNATEQKSKEEKSEPKNRSANKYTKKDIGEALNTPVDNTPTYIVADKYKYKPEENKFVHASSGRKIAENQLPKILEQFFTEFPYKETAAGNQGFSKFTEENITIYRPPTKIESPEIVVIDGKISTIEAAKKAVEGKTNLEEFLNKYC